MFVPVILGSNKTTVSVATGHTEYWPLYLSIGNIHNSAQCAHKNGIVLLGFLTIPKSKFDFYIMYIKSEQYQQKESIQMIHHTENSVNNSSTHHLLTFWTLSSQV